MLKLDLSKFYPDFDIKLIDIIIFCNKVYRKLRGKHINKFKNAVCVSNIATMILDFLNYDSSCIPGNIAQTIYPNFLQESNNFINHPRFIVTGTNGKTTTCGILYEILKKAHKKALCNQIGANLQSGIATALANGLHKFNCEVKSYVIECDEGYFPRISNNLVLDYAIITNLFPDQIDRYGTMEIVKDKILEGIKANPKMKLIMNADDPSLSDFQFQLSLEHREYIYYGMTKIEYVDTDQLTTTIQEANCPICGKSLNYNENYYAQLGNWYCSCSNKRPKLDISAKTIIYPDKIILDIEYKNQNFNFEVNLTGLYNAYNVLGAISAALIENISQEDIQVALTNYTPAFGRHQIIQLKNGGELVINLVKNPVGANEILSGLNDIGNSKILIAINDNRSDGKDVSWLFDTNFEILSNVKNPIHISGLRSLDVALRLKYSGINENLLEIHNPTEDIYEILETIISNLTEKQNLIVLANYTETYKINTYMKRIVKRHGI